MQSMVVSNMAELPDIFCWTRFGTEAGQPIDRILERKEAERRANAGLFLWGIGNSVGAGIAELVRQCEHPEVLFSPIRGRPRHHDVSPDKVVEWKIGETASGARFALPETILVTSRRGAATLARTHYALVCASAEPLIAAEFGRIPMEALRNLVSGHPVGASQVTAVVRRDATDSASDDNYLVAIRARLVPPYFVRLRDPMAVSASPGAGACTPPSFGFVRRPAVKPAPKVPWLVLPPA